VEFELGRVHFRAAEVAGANRGRSLDSLQMLGLQAGLGPARADIRQADGRAGENREGQRGAQDLSPALAQGCVNGQHGLSILEDGWKWTLAGYQADCIMVTSNNPDSFVYNIHITLVQGACRWNMTS